MMQITEPDYSVALVCASLLDHTLEEVIPRYLVPLTNNEKKGLFDDDKRGPLSTFSAKIRMGHAVGIYGPKTKADLNTIKTIRNAFAHSGLQLSFAEPSVAAEVNKLHVIFDLPEHGASTLGAKNIFIVASFMILTGIRGYDRGTLREATSEERDDKTITLYRRHHLPRAPLGPTPHMMD